MLEVMESRQNEAEVSCGGWPEEKCHQKDGKMKNVAIVVLKISVAAKGAPVT